ncbi:MAG: hypothetical protein HY815_19000 [Candidatus Riflebacteria bacterium]|nr:hypothetical protein [Candidatus Riflebacteria bacterium]
MTTIDSPPASPEGEPAGGLGGRMSEAKGPPSRTTPPGPAAELATRTTRRRWARWIVGSLALLAWLFFGLYFFGLIAWGCQALDRPDWAIRFALRTYRLVINDGELTAIFHQAQVAANRRQRQWGPLLFEWDGRDHGPERIERALPLLSEIYESHRSFFGRGPRRLRIRLTAQMHGAEGQFDTLTLHLLAARLEDRELLLHEMSHVFLTDFLLNPGYVASCPAWFDEGLAEWLTVRSARSAEYRDYPHLKALEVPRLDRLNQTVLQAKIYWPAYTLVDDLLTLVGEDGLRRMVELLRRGLSFERAFFAVSGRRAWSFLSEWRERFVARLETPRDAAGALERARFFIVRGNSYQARLYLDRAAAGAPPDRVAVLKVQLLELEGDQAAGQVRRRAYRSALVLLERAVKSLTSHGPEVTALNGRLQKKLGAAEREATTGGPATAPGGRDAARPPPRQPSLLGFAVAALLLAAVHAADRFAGSSVSGASRSLEGWARRHPRILYLAFTAPIIYFVHLCGGAGLEYGQGFYHERDVHTMEAGRTLALAALPLVLAFGIWVLSGPAAAGADWRWALVTGLGFAAYVGLLAATGSACVWPDRTPFGLMLGLDLWLSVVMARVFVQALCGLLDGPGRARPLFLAALFDLFWVGLAPSPAVHAGALLLGLSLTWLARRHGLPAAAGCLAGAQVASALLWAAAPSISLCGVFVPTDRSLLVLGGLWGPFAGVPAALLAAMVWFAGLRRSASDAAGQGGAGPRDDSGAAVR